MSNNVSNLAKLKLEVIKYHTNQNGESNTSMVNQYFLHSLARDACYTSNNSLQFKKKQIADSTADYDSEIEKGNNIGAERVEQKVERLYLELDELQIRHDADCQVYTLITGGQAWMSNTSSSKQAPKKESAIMKKARQLKAEVGA
jgi:hypothetical protein